MNNQKNNYCLLTREACYLHLKPSGRTFCLLPLILRMDFLMATTWKWIHEVSSSNCTVLLFKDVPSLLLFLGNLHFLRFLLFFDLGSSSAVSFSKNWSQKWANWWANLHTNLHGLVRQEANLAFTNFVLDLLISLHIFGGVFAISKWSGNPFSKKLS